MEGRSIDREFAARAVVPGAQVRLTGEAARVIPPRPPGECDPQINLVHEGSRVRAIDIRCSCGKRIYLECEF